MGYNDNVPNSLPGSSQFPWDVKSLLQPGLQSRDRYQEGRVSPHGLAVATGQLEAQLDRLLDRHFAARPIIAWPNISATSSCI